MKDCRPPSYLVKVTKSSLAVITWSMLLCQTPGWAQGQNYLESGIRKFDAGQYEESMSDFWHADSEQPHNGTIHYYMGSALSKMNKPQDARFHFQKAAQFAEPGSKVKELANAAIAAQETQSIVDPVRPNRRNPNSRNGLPGLSNNGAYNPQISVGPTSSPYSQPYSSSPYPNQTQDPYLSKQERRNNRRNLHQARHQQRNGQSGRAGNSLSYPGSDPSSLIAERRYRADREIARITRQNPPDAVSEIKRVKDQCEEDCDRIRREANAQQGTDLMQDTASNLQSQMQDQKLTGSGVRLMPTGTNLNVRNYEHFHSAGDDLNNIIPLIAKPQRLQDLEPKVQSKAAAAAPTTPTTPTTQR